MKIYDLIKLKEDLDIRAVSGGGYEIFDTETGRRAPNTIIYPDEGSAETRRDALRTRTPTTRNGSTAGPPSAEPELRADPADAPNKPGEAARNRSFNDKWQRVRRWIGPLGDIVFTVAMWAEIEQTMRQLWNAKETGQITQEAYEIAVARAFGAWVASFSPLVIRMLARGVSAGGRGLIRAIRAWNGATSLAIAAGSTATGPGAILGAAIAIFKFIILEASTWAAAYYISTSRPAQEWLASWIFSSFWGKIFEVFEIQAQRLANIDTIISRAVGGEAGNDRLAPEQMRDAKAIVGLSPQEIAAGDFDRQDPGGARVQSGGEPAARTAPANAPSSRNPLAN